MKDIIPLGFNCGITFSLQALKIKKETSLFEWFHSDSLSVITKIVNLIQENIDTSIIVPRDRFVQYFNDESGIYSEHYSSEEFKDIFIRRVQRFIDMIKKSKSILFVRIEDLEFIKSSSEEELEEFKQSILKINPDLTIHLFIIDIIEEKLDFIPKNNSFLTHVYFLRKDRIDPALGNDPIFYEFLKNQLISLEYTIEINNLSFNDKS